MMFYNYTSLSLSMNDFVKMLKVIVFKNFVHFKNKTVISLDVSKKGQAGNSNVDGKPTTGLNFLNIFVGANFSGKSAVLELVRRCMTEKINASVTSSRDDNLVAYAFCKFDMDSDQEIISGIIKDPNTDKVFKIIFSSEKIYVIVFSNSYPKLRDFYRCQPRVDAEILAIFKEEDDDISVNQLLKKIKYAYQENNRVSEKCTASKWNYIADKYVTTFPLRGIGSLQWSRSKKIAEALRENNYRAACERAEIISELLSEKQKQFVNSEEEKRIFKYLTDSEDFEFEKKDDTGMIEVKHNGKPFPLLKISEGIFEAKSTSLLLAHTQFKTLCLEDPDRGMHPQMIERLRSVLYESGLKKTIIVVTHSPYFIDNMTIDKTHVFSRTKTEPPVCSVLNIGQSEELSKVADIEIKRTLLFATRVLLVEGVTDREVVHGILNEHKCIKIEENKSSKEDFTDVSVYQIIPVGGCSSAAKVRKFCNDINLQCLCLLDLDGAVKFDIEQLKRFEDFDIDWREMFKETLRNHEKESKDFSEKLESQLKLFIWKHGELEDAILSSADCNEGIASALGMKEELNPRRLKTKLKERIDDEKRKRFYTELMKVGEIKRFIKFIEDNTRTSKPTGVEVDTK